MTYAKPQPTDEQYRARFCRLVFEAAKAILIARAERERQTEAAIDDEHKQQEQGEQP